MAEMLYAKDGKIYAGDVMEVYVPLSYFNDNIAIDKGSAIETFGITYLRTFKNGVPSEMKMLNIPVTCDLMVYDSRRETIKVKTQTLDVLTLQYLKDSYVLHQTVQKGREVAESFLSMMLAGKLPKSINYTDTINMWWRNLEISGVSFKVPSKIYEMIIASIYRNPNNPKERYGQWYGKQSNPSGYEYKTGNVRSVVKDLSTFSGMVFEDVGTMISNGVNNSLDNVEEPVSPLEKIIHY
jgi:hypothetical protein